MAWSQITRSCPLCKAPFEFVLHEMRAADQFTTTAVPLPSDPVPMATTPAPELYITGSLGAPVPGSLRRLVYSRLLRRAPPPPERVRAMEAALKPGWMNRLSAAKAAQVDEWMIRELTVLVGEEGARFTKEVVVSLGRSDEVSWPSKAVVDYLEPMFGSGALVDKFVEELRAFIGSAAVSVKSWDGLGRYTVQE